MRVKTNQRKKSAEENSKEELKTGGKEKYVYIHELLKNYIKGGE